MRRLGRDGIAVGQRANSSHRKDKRMNRRSYSAIIASYLVLAGGMATTGSPASANILRGYQKMTTAPLNCRFIPQHYGQKIIDGQWTTIVLPAHTECSGGSTVGGGTTSKCRFIAQHYGQKLVNGQWITIVLPAHTECS